MSPPQVWVFCIGMPHTLLAVHCMILYIYFSPLQVKNILYERVMKLMLFLGLLAWLRTTVRVHMCENSLEQNTVGATPLARSTPLARNF